MQYILCIMANDSIICHYLSQIITNNRQIIRRHLTQTFQSRRPSARSHPILVGNKILLQCARWPPAPRRTIQARALVRVLPSAQARRPLAPRLLLPRAPTQKNSAVHVCSAPPAASQTECLRVLVDSSVTLISSQSLITATPTLPSNRRVTSGVSD